jgi:hypothetical protein
MLVTLAVNMRWQRDLARERVQASSAGCLRTRRR